MNPAPDNVPGFAELGLPDALCARVAALGYTAPTPIQAQVIPVALEGRDIVGQAQTGTGKTAAFALPLLARIETEPRTTRVLVLAPTRELANQVADAFTEYGAGIRGLNIAAIYGGQAYGPQLATLRRGAHVVVGTPGRVIDHMRKGTLDVASIEAVVLDEADEMLRMGFIDDVRWVLEQLPDQRQMLLLSATMPGPIRTLAETFLRDPEHVRVQRGSTTAATVRQRAMLVPARHRLDALLRVMEVSEMDGALCFVRTRADTVTLAEALVAAGYAAAPLSGDISQAAREATVDRVRNGEIDVLVATDVAARGLDIERISHVFNVHVPDDVESYVHRIGRTGRAGRAGEAVAFALPAQRGRLRAIERVTGAVIEPMDVPSADEVNAVRAERLRKRVRAVAEGADLARYAELVESMVTDELPATSVAAALARLAFGDRGWAVDEPRPTRPERPRPEPRGRPVRERAEQRPVRDARPARGRSEPSQGPRAGRSEPSQGPRAGRSEPGMVTWRADVGARHGLRPKNLVAAIANATGISGKMIGRIDIQPACTFVDLPEGMTDETLQVLQRLKVMKRPLRLTPASRDRS